MTTLPLRSRHRCRFALAALLLLLKAGCSGEGASRPPEAQGTTHSIGAGAADHPTAGAQHTAKGRVTVELEGVTYELTEAEWEWVRLNEAVKDAYAMGDYVRGIELAEEALRVARSTFGDIDEPTLISLSDLGALYLIQGRYGDAEPLLEEALEGSATLGLDHPDTLTRLGNLGALYVKQGRYGDAEPLLEQALERSHDALGSDHPITLMSVNNLATLYDDWQRYGDAEPLYEQAFELSRVTLGRDHPQTLTSLSNLGDLHLRQGRYGDAERLLEQAHDGRRDALGPDHPQTLTSLNKLADLYFAQGRYGDAEPLYEQALERRRATLGSHHPQTLTSLNNLALLRLRQGRYGEAEGLIEEAWTSARSILGEAHPRTLNYYLNTAVILAAQKRFDEAAARLREMEPYLLIWLGAELYSTEATAVRRQLVASQSGYEAVALSIAAEDGAGAAERELGASAVLRFKGLQAEEEAFLARIVRRGDNPEAVRLATEIARLRSALGVAFHGKATEEQITGLRKQLESKELELAKISRAYAQQLQIRKANVQELQSSLPPNSLTLEMRRYQSIDFVSGFVDVPHYAGVLVGARDIGIIDLGPADELDGFAATFTSEDAPPNRRRAASFALYDRLLAPFARDLKNIETLYIAADGPLHLVPFARLMDGEGQLLAERLDLEVRMVQTGRDLLRPPAERPATGLLALGGIDFGRSETQRTARSGDALARGPFVDDGNRLRSATFDAFRRGFTSLPGMAEEVKAIAQIYRERRPEEPVEVWDGANATEERLEAHTPSPRVLHLATHGFYRAPEGPFDRPMLLAGISLAGANDALKEGGHDGILYAIEAQGLNLEGTELVVLSACETAQGVIDYSEGVYGLVRAFRTAGARNVLVTLRPVGDETTRDFMAAFYEHWLDQERSDPAAALRATQLDYIKAGRPTEAWAPYVLIGGAS